MNHELTVTLPPQPTYLNADPIRLAPVVSNLLNNACKFTERGGRFDRPSSERASRPREPSGAKPVATVQRRVLVVDDSPDAADSLAMLLKLSGHEVHTAHDGLEAVEVAAKLQPDVILLDIGLPRLDGYEAARQIREQQREKGLVLVALTGWGQDEDRRRSEEAGFDAHMVQPVDLPALSTLLVELTAGQQNAGPGR